MTQPEPPTNGDMSGYGTPPYQPPAPGDRGAPEPAGSGQSPPGPGWAPPAGNWGPPSGGPGQSGTPWQGQGWNGTYHPNLDPLAKSKLVAGILGIVLGGFGVHRFYLGYTQLGIIQLVVTIITCGIGAIWGFVEGILYLIGTNGYRTDVTGRPLKDTM